MFCAAGGFVYRNGPASDDKRVGGLGARGMLAWLRAMGAWHRITVCAGLLTAGGGCFPRESQQIGAVDPAANIPAIQAAARDKDYKAVPALVQQLKNDDPAVRFYAIRSLRTLTGQTLGFVYFDDPDARRAAVERWQRWVKDHPAPSATP